MEKKENILEEKYRKENINISEEKYMKEAIKQAQKAYAIDEVPIGCVIVKENKIIAKAYNKRNTNKTTLAHAELLAIQKACKKLGACY